MNNIHVRPSAIEKHRAAPLHEEREQFLTYRKSLGMGRVNVRSLAAILIHVVRLLELEKPRQVTIAEIENAADLWTIDDEHHSYRKGGVHSKHVFVTGAKVFLRFHGLLDRQLPAVPFERELCQYLQFLKDQRGLAPATIKSHRGHLTHFLKWIDGRHSFLSAIAAADIVDYLNLRKSVCTMKSVVSAAQPLRSFFAYGETLDWCIPALRQVITFANGRRYDPDTVIPTWSDVRRILDENVGEKPSDLRNRAMLLLCSIYGFRSSEVARLRLGDIDWRDETLFITRSKNGRTQRYPLQFEVGEAILKYLVHGRPRCPCRNLFVSRTCPYRPVTPTVLSLVAAKRMELLGIKSSKRGPHALRHACATELLRRGTSLRQIADFLGHRDLTTVSVYARYDTEALREVAAFSLKPVL